MILINPNADLLRAYGSFEPVGFFPIKNIPTKWSILSAIDKHIDNGSLGQLSTDVFGRYCSLNALHTSLLDFFNSNKCDPTSP